MKTPKRIFAGGLASVLIISAPAMPVAAAVGNPYAWDGCSAPAADRIYYIYDNITVDGSFTLPHNSRINILSGGSITVSETGSLTLDGTLSIENGASAAVLGTLSVNTGGGFFIDGILTSSKNAGLNVSGDMLCTENSTAYLLGASDYKSSASLYSCGSINFAGSLSSAGVINVPSGTITVSGKAALGAGSTADIGGTLSVPKNASVSNSGTLTLGTDSRYILGGTFGNSNGGAVRDNRKKYKDDALTAQNMSLYTCDALQGIDVSVWQGDIDWAKVKKSGIDFAVIRSSRGRISDENPMAPDSTFHQNALGAMKNGIPFGVYHYCYAETVDEARDEARMVLSLIRNYDMTYPIAFDIEDQWFIDHNYSKETLTAMTQAFCDEIAKAGYIPVVYTYASFLNNYLDMEQLSDYPVWVADTRGADKPAYDGMYFLWQYSWTGKIDGITDDEGNPGDVDMSYSYIDFDKYTRENKLNHIE